MISFIKSVSDFRDIKYIRRQIWILVEYSSFAIQTVKSEQINNSKMNRVLICVMVLFGAFGYLQAQTFQYSVG